MKLTDGDEQVANIVHAMMKKMNSNNTLAWRQDESKLF